MARGHDYEMDMLIDLEQVDKKIKGERQTRPRRHLKLPEGCVTGCGHLPNDGTYRQIPMFFDDFVAISDCPACTRFVARVARNKRRREQYRERRLKAFAKLVAESSPVCNTGVVDEATPQ